MKSRRAAARLWLYKADSLVSIPSSRRSRVVLISHVEAATLGLRVCVQDNGGCERVGVHPHLRLGVFDAVGNAAGAAFWARGEAD